MNSFWANINELISVIEEDKEHGNFQKLVNKLYNTVEKTYQFNLKVRCEIFKSAGFLGFPPKQVSDEKITSISIIPFVLSETETCPAFHTGTSIEYKNLSMFELIKLAKQNHIQVINIKLNNISFLNHCESFCVKENMMQLYFHLDSHQFYVEF